MDFFSNPVDPKYDTVFNLLKFASAALTFSAGVVGIYSDRTLQNMRPTRLGWTLIALLFLGATSGFWTEWRQERASSAYASAQDERLRKLASTSDTLLSDTTKIETNAAKELDTVRLTVKKVGKLGANADETIRRVSKTDDDTLKAVRAAESTETRSIELDAQNHRALDKLTMVEGLDSTTLSGIAGLNAQTKRLNNDSKTILAKTADVIKNERRAMFPLFRTLGLQLSFWQEEDPSFDSARAVTTRFQTMISDYNAGCASWSDGRVIFNDSEFSFQGGRLVSITAYRHSPAFPSKDEWSTLFTPAELAVSVWLPTSYKSSVLASSDLDMTTRFAPINPLSPPAALTYFVERNRIGISSSLVSPAFEPANLDIVGMEDLYGSHIVTKLKPSPTQAALRPIHLGELSFVEGPERFAFNASNTQSFPDETGYQVDLPRDEHSFNARYGAHVVPLPVRAPCTTLTTRIDPSATSS
jgi:hypothetical protein